MNAPNDSGQSKLNNERQVKNMKKLYSKKSLNINFNKRNKRAIAHKRKKENLIFASLIREAEIQLTM